MKKNIFIFSVFLLLGTLLMVSCAKDDGTTPPADQSPVINFVAKTGYLSGDATLAIGEIFKVNIIAFANTSTNSKLVRLTISRVYQNTPTVVLDSTISQSSMNAEFSAQALNVAGQEKWIYKVTDKAGLIAEVSFTLTTASASGPINAFSMKIMGAQNTTAGSSFASIDGSVYTLTQAKANQSKVDWMYYFGATDLASIAAPDDAHAALIFTNATNGLQTWTTKNATRFKAVTNVIDWANITTDLVIVQQTASGVTESRITNLTAGKYLAFISASGKKGMIKVESITAGETGGITISVKVQQ